MDVRWLARSLTTAATSRDPRARYEARFSLMSRLARRNGFELYNRHLWWTHDEAFLAAWTRFPEHDGRVKDRRYVLWSLAKSVAHLDGDTVECGSYAGASSHLIASIDPDRPHHIFDSFEGLSEPVGADAPDRPEATAWNFGDLAVDEDRVKRNLADFNVVTYKGWIPTRFDEVADRRFRLVHVDVDLLEPTRDSVEFFWPLLVAGGAIVCDDYGSTLCPGATAAMDAHAASVGTSVVSLTTGQGILFKHAGL